MHIVYDTEVFKNTLLFVGRVLETRALIVLWGHDHEFTRKLGAVMGSGHTFVSFNGNKFDLPIISAMLAGLPSETIKTIANAIIELDTPPWRIAQRYSLVILQ